MEKVYLLLLGQCTEMLVDTMKHNKDWVIISSLSDPNLLFKFIERSALKQLYNNNKMGVLVAEQQSATQLLQEDQVIKLAHYGQSTTRVEIACQAGVCYHTSDLLQSKTTCPRMGDQESLSSTGKKFVVDRKGWGSGQHTQWMRPDSDKWPFQRLSL